MNKIWLVESDNGGVFICGIDPDKVDENREGLFSAVEVIDAHSRGKLPSTILIDILENVFRIAGIQVGKS